jgi:hypothetical protein
MDVMGDFRYRCSIDGFPDYPSAKEQIWLTTEDMLLRENIQTTGWKASIDQRLQ